MKEKAKKKQKANKNIEIVARKQYNTKASKTNMASMKNHNLSIEAKDERKLLSGEVFSGQKPCTRIILLAILQSFLHFLKAKDINSCLK